MVPSIRVDHTWRTYVANIAPLLLLLLLLLPIIDKSSSINPACPHALAYPYTTPFLITTRSRLTGGHWLKALARTVESRMLQGLKVDTRIRGLSVFNPFADDPRMGIG